MFVRFDVRQRVFGPLPGSLRADFIDLCDIFGRIGKNGHNIRLHFGHSAGDSEQFLPLLMTNLDDPVFEERQHRRMLR
jgi:hypothetical protein